MGLGFRVEGFDFSLDLDLRWVLGWGFCAWKGFGEVFCRVSGIGAEGFEGFRCLGAQVLGQLAYCMIPFRTFAVLTCHTDGDLRGFKVSGRSFRILRQRAWGSQV